MTGMIVSDDDYDDDYGDLLGNGVQRAIYLLVYDRRCILHTPGAAFPSSIARQTKRVRIPNATSSRKALGGMENWTRRGEG